MKSLYEVKDVMRKEKQIDILKKQLEKEEHIKF